MQFTRALLQQRQPMIRFLGKRSSAPKATEAPSTPSPHPASPTHSLPDSFASYRQRSIQHGPLKQESSSPSPSPPPKGGSISYGSPRTGRSGHSLGNVQPAAGQLFDRSELPQRFQRTSWTVEEMDAIESGGASVWA